MARMVWHELREELGVDIETARPRISTGSPRGRGQRTELSAWLVREWSGTPSNLTAGEHVAIGWFDKKDLPEPRTH